MICDVSLVLGSILVIAVLMIWMKLSRLLGSMHADLTALRESIDRLAGVSAPADEVAVPGEVPEAESSAVPSEPEMIGFSCPECGKFFEGPATLAGTAYKCPECHVDFHIH